MQVVTINYLTVLVCAVVSLIIGFLWYDILFSKIWITETGKLEDESGENFSPVKTYSFAFVAEFVMAFVLAYLISLTKANTVVEGLRVAFVSWVGFILVVFFLNRLFEKSSKRLFWINSMYYLINLLIFAVILILW